LEKGEGIRGEELTVLERREIVQSLGGLKAEWARGGSKVREGERQKTVRIEFNFFKATLRTAIIAERERIRSVRPETTCQGLARL